MARYCFYCGRTLHSGEKCNCRTTGEAVHASAGAAGPDTARQSQNSGSQQKTTTQDPSSTGTKKNNRQKSSNTKSSRAHVFKRTSAQYRAAFLRNLPALMARLQTFSRYVMKPVDTVRQNLLRPSFKRSIAFFVFQVIMSGLLMMTAAGKPSLATLFGAAASTQHPALLFAEGAALSAVSLLLLGLAYALILRFVHRKPIRFQTLADALSTVSFYLGLFLLFAFFSISSSPITSLVLLVSGISVSLLVQYFTFRHLTPMEENQLVMLVFSASFLASSAFGILVGLA